HELICAASGVVIVQLLVNCGARLACKVWIVRRYGYTLLTMARGANLLHLVASAVHLRVGEYLKHGRRPYHLRNRCRRAAAANLRNRRWAWQDAERATDPGESIESRAPALHRPRNDQARARGAQN